MPQVEEAVCVFDGRLVDAALLIEDARAWGRPFIDRFEFLCCECGAEMTAAVGTPAQPLRHSPYYRLLPQRMHESHCPYLHPGDVRRVPQPDGASQYVGGRAPAVFELPRQGTQAATPKVRPILEPSGLPPLDRDRLIRVRTRSLERLAGHYARIRASNADAPLTMAGCPGRTYLTVFKRMSQLTVQDLEDEHIYVFVGRVSRAVAENGKTFARFSTGGSDAARGGVRFQAMAIVSHDLTPPLHLQSVRSTLETSGSKILYVVGRFRRSRAGNYFIAPSNASLVHAAIRATSNTRS